MSGSYIVTISVNKLEMDLKIKLNISLKLPNLKLLKSIEITETNIKRYTLGSNGIKRKYAIDYAWGGIKSITAHLLNDSCFSSFVYSMAVILFFLGFSPLPPLIYSFTFSLSTFHSTICSQAKRYSTECITWKNTTSNNSLLLPDS